jgi:chemotaxis signal transduction protein
MREVMGMGDQAESGAAPLPSGLAELLAAARANTPEAMERMLHTAGAPPASTAGVEHLLFACADVPCALPLTALREVMRPAPATIPLPHSPPWMHGVFPWQSEIMALVDPAPMLLGRQHLAAVDTPARLTGTPPPTTMALVVGDGERALAWMVDTVGDIAAIEAQDVRAAGGADLPPRERYVTGVYEQTHTGARYALLDAGRLLDDLLDAIAEGGPNHG